MKTNEKQTINKNRKYVAIFGGRIDISTPFGIKPIYMGTVGYDSQKVYLLAFKNAPVIDTFYCLIDREDIKLYRFNNMEVLNINADSLCEFHHITQDVYQYQNMPEEYKKWLKSLS